ncbi:hypothetical protein GOP47_0027784 [Adiantum capillus-veneris]|nr:hypothetical protein GOP47_0027784 [Adiantum capillus-veneris]
MALSPDLLEPSLPTYNLLISLATSYLEPFQLLAFMHIEVSLSSTSTRLSEEVRIVVKGNDITDEYVLKVLTSLDVSDNLLTGPIPSQLGELVGSRYLNLSRNLLSGLIPETLSNLRVLESMDLSSNQLQGQIPSSFSKLTSLGVFDASFNKDLDGPIPVGSGFQSNASFRGDSPSWKHAVIRMQTMELPPKVT